MAGKPEEVDEQCRSLETPSAGGRVRAGGLWVAEDNAEPQKKHRTHPLYKKLSSLNAEVNGMSRGQLKQRLRDFNLEPRLVYPCLNV